MQVKVPDNIQSVHNPAGRIGLSWGILPDANIQRWLLVRCDYPIGPPQAAALLTGGLDLMVTRWELHPSHHSALDDTGVDGKHYVVLGEDDRRQVHVPPDFRADESATGALLSDETAHSGWIKGVKGGKDPGAGVF